MLKKPFWTFAKFTDSTCIKTELKVSREILIKEATLNRLRNPGYGSNIIC